MGGTMNFWSVLLVQWFSHVKIVCPKPVLMTMISGVITEILIVWTRKCTNVTFFTPFWRLSFKVPLYMCVPHFQKHLRLLVFSDHSATVSPLEFLSDEIRLRMKMPSCPNPFSPPLLLYFSFFFLKKYFNIILIF